VLVHVDAIVLVDVLVLVHVLVDVIGFFGYSRNSCCQPQAKASRISCSEAAPLLTREAPPAAVTNDHGHEHGQDHEHEDVNGRQTKEEGAKDKILNS